LPHCAGIDEDGPVAIEQAVRQPGADERGGHVDGRLREGYCLDVSNLTLAKYSCCALRSGDVR
jgi:hypothetical protein